jgi:ABC-type glucose/galactose transport system permease subunit
MSGFWLSIPGAILIALALLAIFSKQRWFLILLSAALILTMAAIYLLRDPGMATMMLTEGCLGPQGLKFASLAVLSALLLWRART